MTKGEMESLGVGDILTHVGSGRGYVVVRAYTKETGAVAVSTITVTNPREWEIAAHCERDEDSPETIADAREIVARLGPPLLQNEFDAAGPTGPSVWQLARDAVRAANVEFENELSSMSEWQIRRRLIEGYGRVMHHEIKDGKLRVWYELVKP